MAKNIYREKEYNLDTLGIETTKGCSHTIAGGYICTTHATLDGRIVHIALDTCHNIRNAGFKLEEDQE